MNSEIRRLQKEVGELKDAERTDNDQPMSANVTVLTAEVRTLMIGSRQVTLSVYRQLDSVKTEEIEPFGRVCDSGNQSRTCICVIGRHKETGCLVKSYAETKGSDYMTVGGNRYVREPDAIANEWSKLPLIVLAGLK